MSRFRRTAARARQIWIGMRLNPYGERIVARRIAEVEGGPPDPALEVAAGADAPEADQTDPASERRFVPMSLAVGAAWSWRLLAIAVAVAGILWLLSHVAMVVIPVAISFLLAAMLQPIAAWLIRHGWNKSLASILVLISGIGVVSMVLTFVVQAFIDGIPKFYNEITDGITQLQEWLESGPMGLNGDDMAEFLANIEANISEWFRQNQETLVQSGLDIASSTATGIGFFFTGLFLVLFTTYFFMRDGRRIWMFLTGMMPLAAREPMRYAGGAGWSTLVQYMRTVIIVAAVDALFIGIGLWLLDILLWPALTALVFLGAFIPIVGATISGAVAVVVALVSSDNGLVTALLVLGIVLAVQQLESNFLQPVLMSRAVKLHPLAIVLAISGGGFAFGILGALVAVPLLAIINGIVLALNRYREARREVEAREAESGGDATDIGEESIQTT